MIRHHAPELIYAIRIREATVQYRDDLKQIARMLSIPHNEGERLQALIADFDNRVRIMDLVLEGMRASINATPKQ